MPRALLSTILCLFIACGLLAAEEAATFQDAGTLSAQTGRPILIEFYRDD